MHFTRTFVETSCGILTAALLLSAAPAAAKTQSGIVHVSATITPNCTLTTQSLAFTFSPPQMNAAMTSQSAITTSCTKGSTVNISVGPTAGTNPGSVRGAQYAMKSTTGNFYLGYNLSLLANRQTQSITVNSRSDAPAVTNLYGTIPGGQHLPPGTYTDVVAVTINF